MIYHVKDITDGVGVLVLVGMGATPKTPVRLDNTLLLSDRGKKVKDK